MKLKRLTERFSSFLFSGKRKYLTSFLVLVVLLLVVFFLYGDKLGITSNIIDRVSLQSSSSEQQEIKTKASPLTGVLVPEELANRAVTAVIIENSPNARPQSSLNEAGVVFEAVAEGGITRFMALYQESKPSKIGPIRSLRPYFLEWAMGFDAPIVHVGGSKEALNLASSLGYKNLNQFAHGSYFYRSDDRFAPHNMYTSMSSLDKLKKSTGYTSSNFDSFSFKDDSPAEQPNARNITIPVSSSLYEVKYQYDSARNDYIRLLAGETHVDKETNEAIRPKNVAVLKTSITTQPTGHKTIKTVGTGDALFFLDGEVVRGSWRKKSRSSNIEFFKADGSTVELNRGQTWITVVENSKTIRY